MPIGQVQNYGSSDSQEIPVSMDNVRPEGTKDQSITSPNREALVRNIHMRRSNASEILHSGKTQDLGLLESGRIALLQVYYI